jgi:hypothetical protein
LFAIVIADLIFTDGPHLPVGSVGSGGKTGLPVLEMFLAHAGESSRCSGRTRVKKL